jgi:glutamate dehydrogenase (NAD(P)+)
MAGQPDAGRAPDRPEIIRLESVPGFVVLDLPDAAVCAGGTRLAPDVTIAEVALLARAMTYKFAALGDQVGGAKAGVLGDSGDRVARAGQMARYCAEIRPLADTGRFLTGPDMGTFEEDFTPLRVRRPAPTAFAAVVAGVAFEDLLTGFGVAVAAETALRAGPGGGWEGRSVAIEGFGKAGGGVAREVTSRGGRVVGLSTVAGCVADPSGLDVERLFWLRHLHGDACVLRYGLPAGAPSQLFTAVDADVVVPGARPGVISRQVAESLPSCVQVVAPAANVPYTRDGADALHRRGIAALPDFVCNAGAVIGYRSALEASPEHVLASVADTIRTVISEGLTHPRGPLAGAALRWNRP